MCVNNADFNEGTTLNATYASDPGSPMRLQWRIGAAGKFPTRNADGSWGEVNAVPREQTGATTWLAIVEGQLVSYGHMTTGAAAGTYVESPPRAIPLSMKVGDSISLKYTLYNKATGLGEARSMTRTFVAMETLDTKLGSFEACRIKTTETLAQGSSASTVWLATEGPYRGQVLKEVVDGGASHTVTSMSYTPK